MMSIGAVLSVVIGCDGASLGGCAWPDLGCHNIMSWRQGGGPEGGTKEYGRREEGVDSVVVLYVACKRYSFLLKNGTFLRVLRRVNGTYFSIQMTFCCQLLTLHINSRRAHIKEVNLSIQS